MNGFISLLKPPGMTSSDAVLHVRRLLPRGTKVGHGGTLDPDAAGMLPICIGRATRLFDFFINKEKIYVAELTLGVTTDTQDCTGAVVRTHPVSVTKEEVIFYSKQLTGDILQTPPAFSAIKKDGKRLYSMARKGEQVCVEPRAVCVQRLDCIAQDDYNRFRMLIVCKKGVYVRTLMHDLGNLLGCGGHMSFLLRTQAGVFTLSNAVTIEALSSASDIEEKLMPLDVPLGHIERVDIDSQWSGRIANGNPVPLTNVLEDGITVRVYVNDVFAGIGVVENESVRFRAMLLDV